MIKILLILAVLATANAQYGYNSNPRQQDHSGGRNLQLDTTGNSYQSIGAGSGHYPGRTASYPAGYNPNSGGRRTGVVQINTSPNNRQYSPRYSPSYPNRYNSNPRQRNPSGGRNVQIDTTDNSLQYIGPQRGASYPNYSPATGGRPPSNSYPNYRPSTSGGRYPGSSSGGGRVMVNGVDYTGVNVNRPGLQINNQPGVSQYSPGYY